MSDVIWSALIAGIVSLVTAWFVSRREAIRTAKEFALADQVQAVDGAANTPGMEAAIVQRDMQARWGDDG